MIDSMTTSLLPVRPFRDKSKIQPTLEVQEFVPAIPEAVHPHMVYTNNFFVYPLMLNFNNQKVYSKVNILYQSRNKILRHGIHKANLVYTGY